jgi:hypothetical protein
VVNGLPFSTTTVSAKLTVEKRAQSACDELIDKGAMITGE